MEPLTVKQREVYEEIERAFAAGRSMPTLRELCSRFRWRSVGSARDSLEALVRKGHLLPADGHARGYRLAHVRQPAQVVPLLGEVPAGAPSDQAEVVEYEIDVPAPVVSGSVSYALRVKGDSMIGAGMMSGDVIFVHQQQVAEVGEIVVARVDGDVTVKRLGRHEGRLALLPENPAYDPIPIEVGTEVLGVVVGLVRGYDRRSA